MICPRCGWQARKVIYMGLPMNLCSNDNCNTVWGFWSWVPALWFNGCFMQYDNYWPALWNWLFGDQGSDGDV